MNVHPALVTGFVPYGGRRSNPAAEIAAALDGTTIAGVPVVGRPLPVSLAEIGDRIADLLEALQPRVVVSVGLSPGEAVIRIERVGLNLADFGAADNAGQVALDEPLLGNGAAARWATLPTRKIETALLEAGIPARISNSAGTFLCNACLYTFLSLADEAREPIACGFIHVPYMPEQVAEMLGVAKRHGRQASGSDVASMALATSTQAVAIAVETALHETR